MKRGLGVVKENMGNHLLREGLERPRAVSHKTRGGEGGQGGGQTSLSCVIHRTHNILQIRRVYGTYSREI